MASSEQSRVQETMADIASGISASQRLIWNPQTKKLEVGGYADVHGSKLVITPGDMDHFGHRA